MPPSTDTTTVLIARRRRVGVAALVCALAGLVGLWQYAGESVWAAACVRVGIVLGAIWLCLPTRTRPAAWAALTPARLIVLVLAAALSYRFKMALPVAAAAGLIAWVLKPRSRSGRSRAAQETDARVDS